MKNYKLVYNTLINCLKMELSLSKGYIKKLNNKQNLVDKIEMQGKIDLLDWIIKEYLPELEGKKCNTIFLTKTEFEVWKEMINEN